MSADALKEARFWMRLILDVHHPPLATNGSAVLTHASHAFLPRPLPHRVTDRVDHRCVNLVVSDLSPAKLLLRIFSMLLVPAGFPRAGLGP